jgi:hypothetical protein
MEYGELKLANGGKILIKLNNSNFNYKTRNFEVIKRTNKIPRDQNPFIQRKIADKQFRQLQSIQSKHWLAASTVSRITGTSTVVAPPSPEHPTRAVIRDRKQVNLSATKKRVARPEDDQLEIV